MSSGQLNALSRLQRTGQNALELQGVTRNFGALVALDNIDLSVKAGERRAVLGSNGAGKTTLFNAITGDFLSTAGKVLFFGEDITNYSVHERIRRGLRRTYQISLLFGQLSLIDNVYLACQGVSPARYSLLRPRKGNTRLTQAEALVDAVHLWEFRDVMVSELSHGQQRQLEIALSLAGAPRFVLFDEPAAGLSPLERDILVNILQALPRHIGFVIIEHDMEVALKVVDQVTIMDKGKIIKEGTPEEIENDPEVQRIYLGNG